jgi:hypothetical protein
VVDHLAEEGTLSWIEIFLFVLVKEEQQVNVLLALQVEIQAAKASALALAASRIRDTRLSDSSESYDHVSAERIIDETALDGGEDRISSVCGQLMEPPRKCL